MALLANDIFLLGFLISSFRHLNHKNLYSGYYFIYSSGLILLGPYMATREVLALLANDLIMSGTSIWSSRNLQHQNLSSTG